MQHQAGWPLHECRAVQQLGVDQSRDVGADPISVYIYIYIIHMCCIHSCISHPGLDSTRSDYNCMI